jgi:predicted aspartyl protease
MKPTALVLAAALAFAAAVTAAPADAAVVADQGYWVGPDGRTSTQVFIDGQGPFNFLLDTAATNSMMFAHVRDRLKLPPAGDSLLKVYGMQNVGTAVPVRAGELRLAGEVIHDLAMGVLSEDSDPADGLIGMDVLSHYVIVLDRPNLRLKLLTPDDTDRSGFADWPSIPLVHRPIRDRSAGFWSMRAAIGGTSVTALFDMGSGMTIVNWAAAQRLGLKRTSFPRDGVPQRLRDALGTVEPVGLAKDATIWLGGRVFRNQIILVANVKVFKYLAMDEKPAAIIGSGLLKDNSLAIDFAQQRLYVGPSRLGEPAEPSPFGVVVP